MKTLYKLFILIFAAVFAIFCIFTNFPFFAQKFHFLQSLSHIRAKSHHGTKVDPKFCANYRVRERLNPNYFYYYNNPKTRRGLLWCKIPKVGSTTLTKLYLRLAGISPAEEEEDDGLPNLGEKGLPVSGDTNVTRKVHKALRQYYPKLSLKLLREILETKSAIKFMVTRDPFERLVSAYRDKLEDYQRDLRFRNGYYYENYGRFMIPAKEFNSTRVPTWSEFIAYLLKTSVARYDEHWTPMSRLCSPCATKFDYIIKLDHFLYQIQHPLKRVGIKAPNIGWSHRTGSGNRQIVTKYFNNLTLIEIKKLYAKYKRDFQLFGYKPYKYFRLGTK